MKRTITSSAIRSTATATATGSASTSSSAQLLKRTKDPLLSSPVAQHFVLPSGSHFIIRPPPSSLPPSLPIPSASPSANDAENSFLSSIATTSSPFVSSSPYEHLLPSMHKPSTSSPRQLSSEEVSELQSLRRSDPDTWTRSKLAQKFGISQKVVGTLGWGEGAEARAAEKARARDVAAEREAVESAWGWKKSLSREERRRRRALW